MNTSRVLHALTLMAWLTAASAHCVQDMPDSIPEPLRKVLRFPMADLYATVEWSMVNRFRTGTVKENMVSHYAAGTVLQENRGNDEGIHEIAYRSLHKTGRLKTPEDEKRHHNELRAPVRTLLADGLAWTRPGESPGIHVGEPERLALGSFADVLAGAARPVGGSHWEGICEGVYGIPRNYWNHDTSPQFTQTREGSLSRVTMSYQHESKLVEVTWDIDHDRDGLARRCALEVDGVTRYASEAELEKMQGAWAPRQIRFLDYTGPGDPAVYLELNVSSIKRDDPMLPREGFTPQDIGVGLGHNIIKAGETDILFWDGVSFLNHEEYMELVQLAGVDPDPAFIEQTCRQSGITIEQYYEQLDAGRRRARAKYQERTGREYAAWVPRKQQPDKQDAWDVYVADFIRKHGLAGRPAEDAVALRDSCKRLRDWYLRKNESALDAARKADDERKFKALEAPVERIFDNRLKPGLENIRRKTQSGSSAKPARSAASND